MFEIRMHNLFFNQKLIIIFLLLNTQYSILNTYSQNQKISFWTPSSEYNPKRVKLLSFSLAGAYTLSMTGLYQLWYKDYPSSGFHFFNDGSEWLQLDKAGHIATTYYVGKWGISLFEWTGMNQKKANWYGGTLGLAFLTSIEIFDGFSSQWGFSVSDMAFNLGGTTLLMSQQLLWNEQRITFKLSYHNSDFARYRPDQFGTTFPEKLVKDYNGHTVWFSGNIKSFLKKDSKFPAWLNLAAGYGVDGLTGANENVSEYNGKPVPHFERTRQIYIAPDIDLTRIKTKSKFLQSIFGAFGFIKFPAPAIEFNSADKVKFHWFYF